MNKTNEENIVSAELYGNVSNENNRIGHCDILNIGWISGESHTGEPLNWKVRKQESK